MLTVIVCKCGRSYRAEFWAVLPVKGIQDDAEGGELVLRNCLCRSTISLRQGDDRICVSIAKVSAARRFAYAHAQLAIAHVRLERANSAFDGVDPRVAIASHIAEAKEQRAHGRYLRREQERLERLLAGMWRTREDADPTARIGRTLVVVDSGAREEAKTDPPPVMLLEGGLP